MHWYSWHHFHFHLRSIHEHLEIVPMNICYHLYSIYNKWIQPWLLYQDIYDGISIGINFEMISWIQCLWILNAIHLWCSAWFLCCSFLFDINYNILNFPYRIHDKWQAKRYNLYWECIYDIPIIRQDINIDSIWRMYFSPLFWWLYHSLQ